MRIFASLLIFAIATLGHVPTAPAHPAPEDLCAPLPSPGDPSRVIAERKTREVAFVQFLQSHLARVGDSPVTVALHGVLPCLKVRPVPGDNRVAAVSLVRDGRYLAGDHLVYWDGGAWRILPLQVDRWPPYVKPEWAARTPEGLELLAHAESGGSGGAGMLQLYRLGQEMRLLWEGSPSGDHLYVLPLNMEYVITIDRSPQTYREPHALQANCCLPVDRQTLWRRVEDGYRPVSERVVPNPYRAVSLFVGGLRAGDRSLAARYATSPEVVAEGARVVREIDPRPWLSMDRGWEVLLEEALSWDAIPPHLRGPVPKVRRMVWPAGTYKLVTARQNGEWKVSAIRPAGSR